MTGKNLLQRVKQKVEASGWLDGTRLTFASIYLTYNPANVPFGLLMLKEEDGLEQIRRKFLYPLEVVGEALAETVTKLGNLPQKPLFQIVGAVP